MKNTVLLSYPICQNTPLYGSTPFVAIKSFSSLANGDSANSSVITIHNHSGTHIDCPRHFVSDGKCLTDYVPDDFSFYSPLVLDIPLNEGDLLLPESIEQYKDELSEADILLIRTGFFKYRSEQKYKTHNPGISKEAFQYLRSNFKGLNDY